MKLHFSRPNHLSQLHDQILAACPAVRPINQSPQMFVEGDGANVWLTVPDTLSVDDQRVIAAVVAVHQPIQDKPPMWSEFRLQVMSELAYIRLATGHPYNSVLNTLLVQLLFRVQSEPGLLEEVCKIWGVMVSNVPLVASEIESLNGLANTFNIPLILDNQGRMSES